MLGGQKKNMPKKINRTQSLINIKTIRNGAIIRGDGVYCGIIKVEPLNFLLKSEDEKTATLNSFQNLLNTFEETLQIITKSRKIDIAGYLSKIENLKESQEGDLLKIQTDEYIKFIKKFVQEQNIISKNFYIVVSQFPAGVQKKKGFSLFKNKKTQDEVSEDFEKVFFQLEQKMYFVSSTLSRIGLVSRFLNTEEAVELLYSTFNPGDSVIPKI